MQDQRSPYTNLRGRDENNRGQMQESFSLCILYAVYQKHLSLQYVTVGVHQAYDRSLGWWVAVSRCVKKAIIYIVVNIRMLQWIDSQLDHGNVGMIELIHLTHCRSYHSSFHSQLLNPSTKPSCRSPEQTSSRRKAGSTQSRSFLPRLCNRHHIADNQRVQTALTAERCDWVKRGATLLFTFHVISSAEAAIAIRGVMTRGSILAMYSPGGKSTVLHYAWFMCEITTVRCLIHHQPPVEGPSPWSPCRI